MASIYDITQAQRILVSSDKSDDLKTIWNISNI